MGFGKEGVGIIISGGQAQALGALAAGAGILVGTAPAITARFRILKTECWATIISKTDNECKGLALYLADGQYDSSELEAALEGAIPLSPNSSTELEEALRYRVLLGHVIDDDGTEAIFLNEEGGAIMRENVRWTFAKTTAWTFFVYNRGATLTTGSTVTIMFKHFGVWVT